MLWFFAVGAAIGTALWVAVRIEPGREPVSADDSGPGSAEKGARLPGPQADARQAVPGSAGGRWPRVPPGARSAVVHRCGEAGGRRYQAAPTSSASNADSACGSSSR